MCALVTGVQTCALPILGGPRIYRFRELVDWIADTIRCRRIILPLPDSIGALIAAFDFLPGARSEEHTSELQSLMRISYAVFCLKKKMMRDNNNYLPHHEKPHDQTRYTKTKQKIIRKSTRGTWSTKN